MVLGAGMWAIPAMLGDPILRNSNLIQNLPLRVLVGRDLAHGLLPLWDPYIWSGTPLLAGFNAGAAYPLSWLFAVMPREVAWVANQASGQVIGACGMMAFARARGRSHLASALAGLSYGFGGFLVAQNVHLDLVMAAGWVPWCMLGLDRLANRPSDRPAAPWIALLGASAALLVLTGSPEPILDSAILLGAFTLWLAWRSRSRRLEVLKGAIFAGVLGALASAAQWLPGAAFQSHSQRAAVQYWFFTSGSMGKGLTFLGIDPYLFGTSHPTVAHYVGPGGLSSIEEVSFYIGMGAVVAVFGLLARRHRRTAEGAERWFWYAVILVGIILAWGGGTPLGHLEVLIPLYNRQRMLVRNVLEVDVALAVLFADWVDVVLKGLGAPGERRSQPGSPADSPPGEHPRASGPLRSLIGGFDPVALPAVLAGALVVGLAVDARGLLDLLGSPDTLRSSRWAILGLSLIPFALALAWWRLSRLHLPSRRVLGTILVVLCVADLAFFDAMVIPSPLANAATGPKHSLATQLADYVRSAPLAGGAPARVAFFDPAIAHADTMDRIGQPDLTLLEGLTTANGNGAIVSEAYDQLTHSHSQLSISAAALGGATPDELDLGVLVSYRGAFMHRASQPGSSALPAPTGDYTTSAPPPPGSVVLSGSPRIWYFGKPADVSAVSLPVTRVAAGSAHPTRGGRLRVGLLAYSGGRTSVRWLDALSTSELPAQARSRTIRIEVPGGAGAIGLEVASSLGTPLRIGQATIRERAAMPGAVASTWRLDGALVDQVTSPQWRFEGMLGPFGVFDNTEAYGAAFLVSPLTGKRVSGSVRLVRQSVNGGASFAVDTTKPALLVRSEENASGWRATFTREAAPRASSLAGLSSSGHAAGSSPGAADGGPAGTWNTLQAVKVAAGRSVVSFSYRPALDVLAILMSLAGWIGLLALFLWPFFWRFRPARQHGGPGRRGAGSRL